MIAPKAMVASASSPKSPSLSATARDMMVTRSNANKSGKKITPSTSTAIRNLTSANPKPDKPRSFPIAIIDLTTIGSPPSSSNVNRTEIECGGRDIKIKTASAVAVKLSSKFNGTKSSLDIANLNDGENAAIQINSQKNSTNITVPPKEALHPSLKSLDFLSPPAAMPEEDENLLTLNLEGANCAFCGSTLNQNNGLMLHICLHTFCRDCLITSIELQTTNPQIKCLIADESNCKGYMLDNEVKSLISPNAYEEYCAKTIRLATKGMKNIYYCRSEGCNGVCQFEEGSKVFHCPSCGKENCLPCEAQHAGISCEEYTKRITSVMSKGESREAAVKKVDNEVKQGGWGQLTNYAEQVQSGHGKSRPMEVILAEIAEKDLLESTKEFECIICYSNVAVGQGVILQDCLHTFCRECLIQTIVHTEEVTVKCPYSSDYECKCFLLPREIKALLSKDLYNQYLSRSINEAEGKMANSFHCKTADCPGWYELEEGQDRGIFKCDVCNKENCIKCKVCHENISCEDYQNRLKQNEFDLKSETALNALVKKGLAMRCPSCQVFLEKNNGCDAIMCSICKTHICWATKGPRWGPKGVGDWSGGCKCRYKNGKLCHPNCKNCH